MSQYPLVWCEQCQRALGRYHVHPVPETDKQQIERVTAQRDAARADAIKECEAIARGVLDGCSQAGDWVSATFVEAIADALAALAAHDAEVAGR